MKSHSPRPRLRSRISFNLTQDTTTNTTKLFSEKDISSHKNKILLK